MGLGFIVHVVVEPGIGNSNCSDTTVLSEYLELVWLFVEGQKEKINRENGIIKNFYQEVSVIYYVSFVYRTKC